MQVAWSSTGHSLPPPPPPFQSFHGKLKTGNNIYFLFSHLQSFIFSWERRKDIFFSFVPGIWIIQEHEANKNHNPRNQAHCGPPSWLLWRKASGCKIGGATVVFSHWGAVFSALWDNGSHKERKNLVRVKASSESKDIHCLPFQFLYKCRDMKHETMK